MVYVIYLFWTCSPNIFLPETPLDTTVGGSKVFVNLVFPDAQPEGVGAPLLLGQVVGSEDAHVNGVEEIQLGAPLISIHTSYAHYPTFLFSFF